MLLLNGVLVHGKSCAKKESCSTIKLFVSENVCIMICGDDDRNVIAHGTWLFTIGKIAFLLLAGCTP